MGAPSKQPGLGVGAYPVRDGKVLMGFRTTGHASGCWAPPGGQVEFGEDPRATCSRDVLEETGLTIPQDAWQLRAVTNDYFPENDTHYITLAFVAECPTGEAHVMEPHKLSEWRWFDQSEIPDKLMASVQNALKAGLDLGNPEQPIQTNC